MPFFPSNWSKYIRRNPYAVGAAIAAPFFLSNDDRGYLQTAVLTTPVIFAANALIPTVFDISKKSVSQVAATVQNLERSAVEFNDVTRSQLASILTNKAYGDNAVAKAVESYLKSNAPANELAKLTTEKNGLTKYFFRKYIVTPELESIIANELPTSKRGLAAAKRMSDIITNQGSKRRLLSNAFDAAIRESAHPGEWRDLLSAKSTLYNNDEFIRLFNKYSDRPNFIRGLSSRVRKIEAKKLVDPSIKPILPSAGIGTSNPRVWLRNIEDIDEWSKNYKSQLATANDVWNKLDPEVARNLRNYMKRNHIEKLSAIAENVINGKVGKLLSLEVGSFTNKFGEATSFRIPLPDSSALVNMDDSGLKYVARHILDSKGEANRIDRWLTRQMAEGNFSFSELAEESSRGYIYHAVDPDDEFKFGMVKGSESSGSALFWQDSALAKSNVAVRSSLNVYGDGQYFTDLDPAQLTRWTESVINKGRFPVMISESGVAEGRFAMPGMEALHPFGIVNAEKQDPVYRSISKEFRLIGDDQITRSPYINSAYEDLLGTKNLPEVGMTTAGIESPIRSVLGDLPVNVADLEASKGNILNKLTQITGSEKGAEDTFQEIQRAYESNKGTAPKFLTDLGRLGETEFMVNSDWANRLGIDSRFRYELEESWIKPGDFVDKNTPLGTNLREVVLPDFAGKVEDLIERDGRLHAVIKHTNEFHGAKVDVAGVKGQAFVVSTGQFDQTAGFLNRLYGRSGRADKISADVEAMADLSYFTNKTEVGSTNLALASDMLSRLDRSNSQELMDMVDEYESMLQKAGIGGIKFQDGQLHIDASMFPKNADAAVERQLRAERMVAFSKVNESFFNKVGEAISKARLLNPDLLKDIPDAAMPNLMNWTLRNHFIAPTRAWDHAAAYVSKQLAITPDIPSYLMQNRFFGALKTLNDNSVVIGGNRDLTLAFGQHLFTDPMKSIGQVFAKDDVKLLQGSLRSAASRAGTILDESLDAYKNNFTIDFGNGNLVPVLGTEAFGGKSHLFGPGDYETWDWQKKLQAVFESKGGKKEVQDYLNTLKFEVFTGKEGAIRPRTIAKNGVPGFLTTRTGTDPFTVSVSPEVAGRIRSKVVRDSLFDSGEAYGMLLRQPISETAHVKVVMDKSLRGTHWIAANEELYRLFQGDADKDPVGLLMWDPKSEAFKEAQEVLASGSQHEMISEYKRLIGTTDFSRSQAAKFDSLLDRTAAVAKKASSGLLDVVRGRMVSSTIGSYSNLLTNIQEQIASNPAIYRDAKLSGRLKATMYQLRQAPISARKSVHGIDLEMARNYVAEMKKQLAYDSPHEAAKAFHQTMSELMTRLYGEENTLVSSYLRQPQSLEDTLAIMKGRSKEASQLSAMYTERGGRALYTAKQVFKDPWKVLGTAHGGMSEVSASQLGEIAHTVANEARNISSGTVAAAKDVFRTHGGKFAIAGLGLAALGALYGYPKRASFDMPSANILHPERVIGVQDHTSGDPYAGAYSGNPPRRRVNVFGGTKTGIVSPMRQSVDLEVKTKTADKDAATEAARISARMMSGQTNTTINYNGDSDLQSLRTREKMRELRDEQ